MPTLTITKDNFETEVMKSGIPVLIDFWAAWCGPCKMIAPVINEISDEVSNVKIGKVNVDEEPEIAAKFNIMSIPTLVVVKNGSVVSQTLGAKPKAAILQMLENI